MIPQVLKLQAEGLEPCSGMLKLLTGCEQGRDRVSSGCRKTPLGTSGVKLEETD